MGYNLYVGIELVRDLLRNLSFPLARCYFSRCIKYSYQSLGFLDVFLSEEELAVEITQIDRIEVDNVDLSEARKDKVL